MKIGYRGIPGDFCCRAAKQLAEGAGSFEPEFVPFEAFADVVKALKKGEIDMGAALLCCSVSGEDGETAEALKEIDYLKVTAAVIPVHLCVYGLNGHAAKESVNKIVSSPQLLKMTELFRRDKFPYAKAVAAENEEAAARSLSEGEYGKYSAVICKKDEGERFGLKMMYENVEDKDIIALFELIRRNDAALDQRTE